MSFTDCYLAFPDAATAVAILPGGAFENIDVVGQVADKWLVNVRLTDDEELSTTQEQYAIDPPLHPKRIWFDSTVGVV